MSSDLIDVAHLLVDAAREPALSFFRKPDLLIDNKSSAGFDPVTEADRAVEATIRELLERLRPNDGISGEEFGVKTGTSGIDWIIDPIDGTRAYLCGAPTWGVLIAAVHSGRVLCGVIDQPYIAERFSGSDGVATWAKGDVLHTLRVRATSDLPSARLLTTFPEVGRPQDRSGFQAVAEHVALVRYGLDCYGYALLAAGQVDLVIEAGLQDYDVAGPIGVIEAAGGIVTTWDGGNALEGGQILASATEPLHEKALDLLKNYVG